MPDFPDLKPYTNPDGTIDGVDLGPEPIDRSPHPYWRNGAGFDLGHIPDCPDPGPVTDEERERFLSGQMATEWLRGLRLVEYLNPMSFTGYFHGVPIFMHEGFESMDDWRARRWLQSEIGDVEPREPVAVDPAVQQRLCAHAWGNVQRSLSTQEIGARCTKCGFTQVVPDPAFRRV